MLKRGKTLATFRHRSWFCNWMLLIPSFTS